MKPTRQQVEALARLAVDTRPEEITCDELLRRIARYAELVLAGEPVPDELRPVAEHLRLCPECTEELEALLESIGSGSNPSDERG